MASSFLERLRSGPPICADGGMGALVTSAVPRLRCPEEANLRAPESVVDLHLGFIRAGAELIETNTFGANRRKLASHFLETELEQINSTGVKLARDAREVSGRDVYIGGSMGPLGDVGDAEEERFAVFAEQAAVLEGRGVDLFMVETFYDLAELDQAIAAVRSVSALPIVALLTFDEDAETLAGVSAAHAAARLRELGVAAMGANHGAGLQAALTALERMRGDDPSPPLAALPNLGLASLAGGRVIYPHATPEYFAEFAAQARSLGAAIVGGCCGTTPTEIAAIRTALDEERQPSAPLEVVERALAVTSMAPERQETALARDLREGRFVVSVQIDPPLGGDYTGLLETVQAIRDSGSAGYVDINDNATASAKLSAMIMASAIERRLGVETIPHLTSRDYSVMGLEALLLGGHAEGVRNILAVTGDPPEVGDYPGAKGIYEVDAIGLTQLIAHLNVGQSYNGKPIDAPTSFFIGVAVNPTADDLELEADRFRRKVEAGAQFAMTQILFDLGYLDDFRERIGGEWPIPVLVGIFPLSTHRLALRLHNEVPGIVVPDELQDRMRAAGPQAAELGTAHARELVREAREKAEGIYVATPFRRPLAALEVLG
ncbi:MAG TPA: bifunctional homocysteine S-methyltransferase/methylenetetrahydrofolate reductase [Gaiellaceae bacterium]|nr:bifunctional homocysteine S-methyltransferase/methylenetetrahydrofolate reductase [Gaiellaceae bacterium]